MGVSGAQIIKYIVYGKEINLHGPADVMHLYEDWRTKIHAKDFNPLIPIIGGSSFHSMSEEKKSMDALLFGQDWIDHCIKAGGNTRTAVICLASNFDADINMVALALELAMIAHKPSTDASVRLDTEAYGEVVNEVFGKNYAGVIAMAQDWGIKLIPGFKPKEPYTRLTWKAALGYDVLIHPKTLGPCRYIDGIVLEYQGTIIDEMTGFANFKFRHPKTNEEILSSGFIEGVAA